MTIDIAVTMTTTMKANNTIELLKQKSTISPLPPRDKTVPLETSPTKEYEHLSSDYRML